MSWRLVLRGLVLIASLAAIGFIVRETGIVNGIDESWIDATVRGQGAIGIVVFMAAGAAFTGVGLPRHIICFLSGYAFGIVPGTVIAVFATLLGCLGTVLYARFMGRDFVQTRFPERAQKIDAFLRDNPFSMTLVIRLLPVGSNLVTNLAAGMTSVPLAWFLLGSAIGYIPQTLIFALLGSGVRVDNVWQITISVVLFLVSGILGVQLFRKFRRNRALDEEIERELAGDAGNDKGDDKRDDERNA
ncbi:MAG: VTT domain-containing protein [Rhodospirillales bacterium]